MVSVPLRIEAATYTLEETPLEGGLVRGIFHKRYPHRKRRFEIFPYVWHLAIVRGIEPGQIALYSEGKRVPLVGDRALFLPPYSVLDWELEGDFTIETIKSQLSLGEGSPLKPVVFELDEYDLPKTLEGVSRCLDGARGLWVAEPRRKPTAVATRAKAYLDSHFLDPLSIGEIARKLRMPRSVMTRAFTQAFGLSPVVYRNHLRVFQAMALLTVQNFRVAEASYHCGFSDLSNFNRHFKRIVEHVPSAFRPLAGYGRRQAPEARA
jgi:AraC-like DNA-binding protein